MIIKDFIIKNPNRKSHNGNDYFLVGVKGYKEYLKQKLRIIKTELWWDYSFGLPLNELNEITITFWIRECLNNEQYISYVNQISVTKKNQIYQVELEVKLVDDEVIGLSISI